MAIRNAEAAVANSTDDAHTTRAVHAWISAFLADKPLSDMRKIAEWQSWASHKLASGWDAEAIKQRILDAWLSHSNAMQLDYKPVPPESPLSKALFEGLSAALNGAKPAQIAVLYRSLAIEHQEHSAWLARYAAIYADMGDTWRPNEPYLKAGW